MHYRDVNVDGQKVFYREAGDPNKPTILLLHGIPMFAQRPAHGQKEAFKKVEDGVLEFLVP